jgi:serine/threonine-protein kinase
VELKTWQHIEELFHEALLVEGPARAAFLSEACSGDEGVRREVESLIAAFEKEQGFLERPAISIGWKLLSPRLEELREGQVIGQYRIVRMLGEGGLGRVYLAEDGRLERPVALKFIAANATNEDWVREQLVKEARAVAKLEHPNICGVYGIEEIDGYRFIVMQYLEGEPLSAALGAGSIDARRALRLSVQLAEALGSAHGRGIIHRDIKPQNIIITPEGQAKILDFGIAKLTPRPQEVSAAGAAVTQGVTQPGLIVGTIAYMSPEQTRGGEVDCRSDIFSLGVVLYEMLSGSNPFLREGTEETLSAVREFDPPTVGGSARKALPGMERVVRRCLEKSPGQRYQTAEELLPDLHALLEMVDGAHGRAGKSAERRRRNRLAYGLSALALILLLAVCAAVYYRRLNRVHTLAVFNVAAENSDSGAADLGAGLSRSLGNRLSRLSGLRVKKPKEASVDAGRVDDLPAAGRELGVEALLVTQVLRRGDALVLHARLRDASDGANLWEEEFPTGGTDLTTLLTRLSQGVASNMSLRLNDADRELLMRREPKDAEAVELYLRGQNYLNKRDEENVRKAIESFSRAVEREWVFAEAHAGLAESYLLLPTVAYGPEKTADVITKARASARQALKIDPTLGEAHTALGVIHLRYDWDWREAEKAFRRAIELNPDYAPAHYWYSSLLMVLGRNTEAIAQGEIAKELEPFSPLMLMNVGRTLYYARRYDEAAAHFSAMLEKDGTVTSARYMLGLTYIAKRMYGKAIETLEKLYATRPLYAAAPLGFAYGKAGRYAEAKAVLDRLDELSKDRPVPAQERAIIHIGLNDKERAFVYLEEAYGERFPSLNSLTTEPLFDDLRSDPRYVDLARRLNLAP